MKFAGNVDNGRRNRGLTFDGDLDHNQDPIIKKSLASYYRLSTLCGFDPHKWQC